MMKRIGLNKVNYIIQMALLFNSNALLAVSGALSNAVIKTLLGFSLVLGPNSSLILEETNVPETTKEALSYLEDLVSPKFDYSKIKQELSEELPKILRERSATGDWSIYISVVDLQTGESTSLYGYNAKRPLILASVTKLVGVIPLCIKIPAYCDRNVPKSYEFTQRTIKSSDNRDARNFFSMSGDLGIGGRDELFRILKENRVNLSPYDNIVEGSGLSRRNKMSPKSVVDVLTIPLVRGEFDTDFKGILARYSMPGTLRKRGNRHLKNNVYAKTGTLRDVATLAGYITNFEPTGSKVVVFAMLANKTRVWQARRAIDTKVNRIYKILKRNHSDPMKKS